MAEKLQIKIDHPASRPHIEFIDIQARNPRERTFILACQAHNVDETQFSNLMVNLRTWRRVGVGPRLIDSLVEDISEDGDPCGG